MLKVRILHDTDTDRLEQNINDFLQTLDPAKVIDVKLTSEASPSELSITRTALILYNE